MKGNTKKVFDSSFNVSSTAYGLYKLHFAGYERNVYVGSTNHKNLKLTVKQFCQDFWHVYNGLGIGESLHQHELKSMSEYLRLSDKDRQEYDVKIAIRRQKKMLDFNLDLIAWQETLFMKMIYFMDLHNLNLNDLRLEILYETTNEKENLRNLELQYIVDFNCWVDGFNPTAIGAAIFTGVMHHYDTYVLKEMKETYENQNSDPYSRWNCIWNLYETYKFSILNDPINWMRSQKAINFDQLTENLGAMTKTMYLVKNDNIVKDPNLDAWIQSDNIRFKYETNQQFVLKRDLFKFYNSLGDLNKFFRANVFDNTNGWEFHFERLIDEQTQQVKKAARSSRYLDHQVKTLITLIQEDKPIDWYQFAPVHDYFKANQETYTLLTKKN